MAKPPVLKDWKTLLEEQLNKTAHGEADILKIIYACQDYIGEMQLDSQWLGQQQGFISRIYSNFLDMYSARFGNQPPPRPQQAPIKEILLETPERRKQVIREVALSITKPGDDVSDEAILEELKRRGIKLATSNPTATISTILYGFKPQFEKVQGGRGIFKRQE